MVSGGHADVGPASFWTDWFLVELWDRLVSGGQGHLAIDLCDRMVSGGRRLNIDLCAHIVSRWTERRLTIHL